MLQVKVLVDVTLYYTTPNFEILIIFTLTLKKHFASVTTDDDSQKNSTCGGVMAHNDRQETHEQHGVFGLGRK